jgi:hypothetical protein
MRRAAPKIVSELATNHELLACGAFHRVELVLPEAELWYCATDMARQLTRVLGEVRRADVRNVAIRTNQYPRPLGCDEFCRVTTAQMIEEPAAIV